MHNRHRAYNQKPSDISLAHLRGAAKLLLASARVLSRDKAKPGCKIATTSECLHRRREGSDCHRANRSDPWHFLEPSHDIALFCFRCDTMIDVINLFVQLSDLAGIKASHGPYQLRQIVRRNERREPLNVGVGLAYLPEPLVADHIASGALVAVMNRYPVPPAGIFVVRAPQSLSVGESEDAHGDAY